MADTFVPRRNRLHAAALVILIVGWLAALGVYLDTSAPSPVGTDPTAVLSPEGSVREDQAIERLGGKATVRTVAFNRWFTSLWHGRSLAWTLAALASVIALLAWYIAGLMAEEVDDAPVARPELDR